MQQFLSLCRSLDPTKIITDDKRLRFSFVGITDIVTFDPNQQNPFQLVNHYQQVSSIVCSSQPWMRKLERRKGSKSNLEWRFNEIFVNLIQLPFQDDLTALGKLIIALACRCLQSVTRDQIQHSIDLISRHYSSDLKNLITYLLSPNKMKSIVEGMWLIACVQSSWTDDNCLFSDAKNWCTLLHTSRAFGEPHRHDGKRVAEGDGEWAALPFAGEAWQHQRERVSRIVWVRSRGS